MRITLSVFTIFLFHSFASFADIDYSNGNFYFSCTDYINRENTLLRIERVYNSKGNFPGIFGIGWSSNFETTLKVSASGEILIHEFGGGSSIYYINDKDKAAYNTNLKLNLNIVADLAIQYLSPGISRQSLVASYQSDRKLLERDYEILINKKLITFSLSEPGRIFYSEKKGAEFIVKTKDGYIRNTDEGDKEYYDDAGRLTERTKDSKSVFIEYNSQNQISQVSDADNNNFLYYYNNSGQVIKIVPSNSSECSYKYEQCGKYYSLISNQDINNNEYTYVYNNVCLIESVSQNSTLVYQIFYNPSTFMPSKIKHDEKLFGYEFGPYRGTNLNDYGISRELDENGNTLHTMKKEFSYKMDKYNHLNLYKIITTSDGFTSVYIESFEAEGNGEFDENSKTKETFPNGKSTMKTKFSIKHAH